MEEQSFEVEDDAPGREVGAIWPTLRTSSSINREEQQLRGRAEQCGLLCPQVSGGEWG